MANPRKSELLLVLTFLAIIAAVPLTQTVVELRRGEKPQVLEVFSSPPTSANLRRYEHALEDASVVAARTRPWAQYARLAWSRDGGSKALVGRDGWLFYRPGLDYITQRGKESGAVGAEKAAEAIIDFRDQLQVRGIRLLVMPTPNKESIYPEKATARAKGLSLVPSPETRALLAILASNRVEVLNLFELFTEAKGKAENSGTLYLAQDTHWSPLGLEMAAQAAAQRLRSADCLASDAPVLEYTLRAVEISRPGDILGMLQNPALERRAKPEVILAHQVLTPPDNAPYRDIPDSEVLVLGDSFLQVFEMDEPRSAGFISHLARELRRPVTSLVIRGGGSTLLRQQLHRGPELLAHRRIVLWEFVERDIRLGIEGWQKVTLPPPVAPK